MEVCALLVGMKKEAATVESIMQVPLKAQNITTMNTSNPISKFISQNTTLKYIFQSTTLKRYLHISVHCNVIHDSQEMETTQMSFDIQMDKENVVHTFCNLEKDGNPIICMTRLNLEDIMRSVRSQ